MRKAFWHKASWNRCMNDDLPGLLADRIDITDYQFRQEGETASIDFRLRGAGKKEIQVTYDGIPAMAEDGTFWIDGKDLIVPARAESEELRTIRCCGDQLLSFLETRIEAAPEGYFIDSNTVKSWIPLTDLMRDFFIEHTQIMDGTNYTARLTHINRVFIDGIEDFAPASQAGKTCPIEIPEGRNSGRCLTVARGAVIEEGKISVLDSAPVEALGFAASMIPFLEHSDPARLMMGANMTRQWMPPLKPKPAIVRTGLEPEEKTFWCGYNLLCAFTSAGALNCEDGIVLSEDAVSRMEYAIPIEIGDKFSTRHGDKGVVSAILPTDRMPRLEDGTPVDLVFSFSGLHTRMNTGVLLEAAAGRIAHHDGKPFVATPFSAPPRAGIEQMLESRKLPVHAMDNLQYPAAPRFPTVAGWVYWGRTKHITSDKYSCITKPGSDDDKHQRVGEMEYWILRNAGAYHTACENAGLRAENAEHAAELVDIVTEGGTLPDSFPSAPLLSLQRKLEAAGIHLDISAERLDFSWQEDGQYSFSEPLDHPWCPACRIEKITPDTANPLWAHVEEEDGKLKTLLGSDTPASLLRKAREGLSRRFADYVDSILQTRPSDLSTGTNILFNVRSLIVPSGTVSARSVGIPDDAAWQLFGPLAARTAGMQNVAKRNDDAEKALDRAMVDSLVVLWRAPSVEPTSAIALVPVRVPHRSIELNPLLCKWLNADFDGDQVSVYLPLGPKAQEELGRTLTVSAHLDRNPELVRKLIPPHEAVWGLSLLWMDGTGRKAITDIVGERSTHGKLLTQWELAGWMTDMLHERGPEEVVDALEKLMDLGFGAAAGSGASLDPFTRVEKLPGIDVCGEVDGPAFGDRLYEYLEASEDYFSPQFGPQLIMTKGSIRGSVANLVQLAYRRHETGGQGLLDGIRYEEFVKMAREMRRNIGRLAFRWQNLGRDVLEDELSSATTVLARARRSDRPGVVFAAAASRKESDPLTDIDARLFCGLVPE